MNPCCTPPEISLSWGNVVDIEIEGGLSFVGEGPLLKFGKGPFTQG